MIIISHWEIYLKGNREMTTPFLVLDTETLGINDNSVIVSFAAVIMTPYCTHTWSDYVERKTDNTFEVALNRKEQTEKYGRTQSKDALDWWAGQSQEVIEAVFKDPNKVDPETGINRFINWLTNHPLYDKEKLVCFERSSGFDFPKVRTLMESLGINTLPWDHRKVREIRTFINATVGDEYFKPNTDYLINEFDDACGVDRSKFVKHDPIYDAVLDAFRIKFLANHGARIK